MYIFVEPEKPDCEFEHMPFSFFIDTNGEYLYGFPIWPEITGPRAIKVGGHFGSKNDKVDPDNTKDITEQEA